MSMSGPALKHWDSHSSIHEAALGEAHELTELLRLCISRNEYEKALEIALITVEHWETRTLCHADAEETGLYLDLVVNNPEAREAVVALTRDHTLMRYLVSEIKQILLDRGDLNEVVKRLDAIILIDILHNHDEGELINREMIANVVEPDEQRTG